MKKTILNFTTIILVYFLIANTALAQEVADPKKVDNKGRPIRYNIIKTNLIGFGIGHYKLAYERKLAKKLSAVLDLTLVNFSLTNFVSLDQTLPGDNGTNIDITIKDRLSGFGITPEIRYYLGKNACRGYYFGLYIPYWNYNASLKGSTVLPYDIQVGSTTERTNISVNAEAKSGFSFIGLGISGGPQFIIANRVTLEFYLNFAVGQYRLKETSITYGGTAPLSIPSGTPAGAPLEAKDNITYFNSAGTPITTAPAGPSTITVRYQKTENINLDEIGLGTTGITILPRIGFNLGVAF
jgi:hypothetical protein